MTHSLTERDFARSVTIETPNGPAELRKKAIQHYVVVESDTSSRAVQRCVALVRSLTEVCPRPNGDVKGHAMPVAAGSMFLHGKQIAREIAPAVQAIRFALFRSPVVPFPSYADAVRWLEREAARQPPVTAAKQARARALRTNLLERAQWLRQLLRLQVRLTLVRPTLAYPSPSRTRRGVLYVPVRLGTLLAELATTVETLSRATGCLPALLTAHILSDVPLVCPPRLILQDRSVRLPASELWIARTEATIHVPAPHLLTARGWMALYRQLRHELPLPRLHTATERHAALMTLVDQLGGVPLRGKVAFWQRCQREWNRRYGHRWSRYDTWRGPEMVYRRLHARFNSEVLAHAPERSDTGPRPRSR
jgi:hypothetical protein